MSLGVLLATFMGGMCLGSAFAPRLIRRHHNPLRVYAVLELAIGMMGLALLAGMPLVALVYTRWGGNGAFGVILRAAICAVCLLPPTAAMGATLPAIARSVSDRPDGMARLGFFYAGNLAGAVMGCVLAGFYLLRVFDMNIATYVAVAINISVAAVAWRMSASAIRLKPSFDKLRTALSPVEGPDATEDLPLPASPALPALPALLIIALSGFCALAAEVIWTRMLSLIFSATVYTFSIILAVFLVGLGLGSTLGSVLASRVLRPLVALGWCQLASVVAMAWSGGMLAGSLPYWPVNTSLASSIWFNFQLDAVRALWAILPAPILWGASFPLALAAANQTRAIRLKPDPTAVVGRVYAANTLGAILGALTASLILVTWLGSQRAQQVMAGVAIAAALIALVPAAWRAEISKAGLVLAIGVAILAAQTIPPLPGVLVGYGRHAAAWAGHAHEIFYVGEGMHASVAVSKSANDVLNYHNAGKIQASSQPPDMRLQRMLGHLTTLVPRHARSVLVIGCGAGVTAGAVAISPLVERVTIVDIEPLVPKVAKQYFGAVNHEVLNNPKVHVVVDDARHFLLTTTEKFDAITSDPLDPWVKGAATLYTKEFFDAARAHLNPDGVMTLFVQLYESSLEAVRSEVATFFSSFPNGLIFGNTYEGHAIDTVLVGQAEAPEIYLDEIDETLRTPAFAGVVRSLGEIGLIGATDLFGNYAGRARDLKAWTDRAQINRDRNLRLQYLAGFGVNLHDGDSIYADILQYRQFPEDLFIASESTIWRLRQTLDGVRE